MDNEYKLRVTRKLNPHNGLFLIKVEGVLMDTAASEDMADRVEHTYTAFPGDCIKEIETYLTLEVEQLRKIRTERFSDDRYYDIARKLQEIGELAAAGERIALLARACK